MLLESRPSRVREPHDKSQGKICRQSGASAHFYPYLKLDESKGRPRER